MESWICSFYLSVAARKLVFADLSLRYTCNVAGTLSNQQTISLSLSLALNPPPPPPHRLPNSAYQSLSFCLFLSLSFSVSFRLCLFVCLSLFLSVCLSLCLSLSPSLSLSRHYVFKVKRRHNICHLNIASETRI